MIIVEADETRRRALDQLGQNQAKIKGSFDKDARNRNRTVGPGTLVPLWDKRREKPGMHNKMDNLWIGPYKVRDIAGENSYYLENL